MSLPDVDEVREAYPVNIAAAAAATRGRGGIGALADVDGGDVEVPAAR